MGQLERSRRLPEWDSMKICCLTVVLVVAMAACADKKTNSKSPPVEDSPADKVGDDRAGAGLTKVQILVPRQGHLQFMSFYLAKGADYFRAEGIDLEVIYPPKPRQTKAWFRERSIDVAVLPPPMCLELIGEAFPFVVVANLLANDPIEMLVRKSIAAERNLSATAPMAERLAGLRGLRVGVSPNPPTRLRKLFALHGMDADRDIEIVVIRGEEHNNVFERGEVDALYVHTPFLERALVEQDVMMLINQSAGEVPELAGRQIHTLAVKRAFASAHPELVTALTRAIYRAQRLVHSDREAAIAALLREVPERGRAQIEAIVDIYGPAIPAGPQVSADKFTAALEYFPATRQAPDLSQLDLGDFVAPEFAARVVAEFASGAGSK
jgi:ABC-type nitrate/sulfonate/bicarbonate transport system substrate-binding protein